MRTGLSRTTVIYASPCCTVASRGRAVPRCRRKSSIAASLGPTTPHDHSTAPTGYQLPPGHRVVTRARLGGQHRDYRLESVAA